MDQGGPPLIDPPPGDPAPGTAGLDVVLAVTGLQAGTVPQALDDLAARLLARGVVGEGFPAALRERETAYPTGLPTPIPTAIPHAEPQHVRTPGLVVATLAAPVLFWTMGAPGERVPVRLIAMPLLTDARAHLGALQSLMGLLRDEEAVRTLLGATDETELARRTGALLRGGAPA